MWSVPPAEPPATETPPGLAFSASSSPFRSWMSELAGTTITPASSVIRAMGVRSFMPTGVWLVSVAPTMMEPATISKSGRPRRWPTKRGSPTRPPAPPTFSNWKLPTSPACRATCSIARPSPSQPPPGPAGMNM